MKISYLGPIGKPKPHTPDTTPKRTLNPKPYILMGAWALRAIYSLKFQTLAFRALQALQKCAQAKSPNRLSFYETVNPRPSTRNPKA